MCCAQEHGSLSAGKSEKPGLQRWKILGHLGLWIKSLAPLLSGAVPKEEFGALLGGHVDGATGIWDPVWQHQNGMGHALGIWVRELLIRAGNRKATLRMDKSHPGENEG